MARLDYGKGILLRCRSESQVYQIPRPSVRRDTVIVEGAASSERSQKEDGRAR